MERHKISNGRDYLWIQTILGFWWIINVQPKNRLPVHNIIYFLTGQHERDIWATCGLTGQLLARCRSMASLKGIHHECETSTSLIHKFPTSIRCLMVDNVMTWGKVRYSSPVSSIFLQIHRSPETKLNGTLEKKITVRFNPIFVQIFSIDNCGPASAAHRSGFCPLIGIDRVTADVFSILSKLQSK